MKNIGKAIHEVRRKQKMSQIEVAQKSGITRTYLSLIETGKRLNVSSDVIEKICVAMEIPQVVLDFMSMDLSDVAENKKDSFKDIKPAVNALIDEFFVKK